jgi:hypothetical protein
MAEPVSSPWDLLEPSFSAPAMYSSTLKVDLLSGTFVLVRPSITRRSTSATPSTSDDTTTSAQSHNDLDKTMIVARIVGVGDTCRMNGGTTIRVNIFKSIKALQEEVHGFLSPSPLNHNHLRNIIEVVQTTEVMSVPIADIINLSFVFSIGLLVDPCELFCTCQGMILAFVVRFRFDSQSMLREIPAGYCLPFPSDYAGSRYHDCFGRRIWNNLVSIKMEIMRLLGRYSQQQGLFGRERGRAINVTSETWGFLSFQFETMISSDFGCASSSKVRIYRLTESGLVVKATRIKKSCSVMRFESKTHLRHLSSVFGESVTAGQRCRLPKVSSPKMLQKNDIINVVCGSNLCEESFNPGTTRDGVDLEFDGSCELYITIRYSRYAYYSPDLDGCDPLLASLIRRRPLTDEEKSDTYENDEDDIQIIAGSEFVNDNDGCLYRVLHMDVSHVHAECFYPRWNNNIYGNTVLFHIELARELIRKRLIG